MPLTAEFYRQRRRDLMARIGDGAAALLPGAVEKLRSHDVEYRFRQNSDLDYLTGFPEPDALCVLLPGHPEHEVVLFVRPRDRDRETWTGRRAGIEGATEIYGADAAHPVEQLAELVPQLLVDRDHVYYSMDRRGAYNSEILHWLETLQADRQRRGAGPTALLDVRPLLHEMRLFKQAEELEVMRRATAITCDAHVEAMRSSASLRYEHELEAAVEFVFRRSGASGPAYPSIVACGANATVLHYTDNCCQLDEHELLLLDAGAEIDAYCADVTRTFPIGGSFDGRQRAIYEIVLAAQEAAILEVGPGVAFESVHEAAVRVLVRGLVDLGILEGAVDDAVANELYKPYFMHRTSHWLGKDVHDVGAYKVGGESRKLEPGMVLTVEPGLYLAEDSGAEPQWQGIGVRIEDDVLVTEAGFEVLSAAAPKHIDEIEALRRGA